MGEKIKWTREKRLHMGKMWWVRKVQQGASSNKRGKLENEENGLNQEIDMG